MAELVLPVERSAPTKKWEAQKILLIGPGKVGKSALLAQGERTLFIETEEGLNHLACMKLPCANWDQFMDINRKLYEANRQGKFPYDTIVIDTIDKLVEQAGQEVIGLSKNKYKGAVADLIETIGDIPNGNGWFNLGNLVSITLDKMREYPAAIVLIGHVTHKEVTNGIRKINKETISIGGQVGTKLLHWADHTLNMKGVYNGQTLDRVFVTKPSEAMDAGSRGNIVPDGFKITADLSESYKRLRGLFD